MPAHRGREEVVITVLNSAFQMGQQISCHLQIALAGRFGAAPAPWQTLLPNS